MGDRYELYLHCSYCNVVNEVWYAPTCGFNTFKCSACKKTNMVDSSMNARKAEEATGDMLYDCFLSETNKFWSDEELHHIYLECVETAKKLRKKNKEKK